jgi:hypothetical protein
MKMGSRQEEEEEKETIGIESETRPHQPAWRMGMANVSRDQRRGEWIQGPILRLTMGVLLLLILGSTGQEVFAQLQIGRPKTEAPLENPYPIGVPREKILETVQTVLKECGIELNEERTRLSEGRVATLPIVFTRGGTTRNNLEYFAAMPSSEVRSWTQGRYYLEITALPLDQNRSQIFVAAHIEGRYADARSGPQWVEGQSNGRLEDEVLRGLAGKILGIDLSLKTATSQRRLLTCIY